MRTDRVVALVDMDCFYVQVEQREEPETWGKPCAVVQYTGGGVIAVNYEARAHGIRRGARVSECKAKCPGIRLFLVPELRGKADLSKYRNASAEVFDVLLSFDPKLVVERASIDEAYLDLTELIRDGCRSFDEIPVSGISVAGTTSSLQDMCQDLMDEDERLVTGSKIMQRLRIQIKEATNFSCSAGVSFNKVLAKLCAGFKKPNGQSVLPPSSVNPVFATTPIEKVRGLGGKLGQDVKRQFAVETMLQLQSIPEERLELAFGAKTANWVHELSKGNDEEAVVSRSLIQSVGSGKNFNSLKKVEEVKHWLQQLAQDLVERLIEDRESNDRTATNVIVNVRHSQQESFSRTLPLKEYRLTAVIEEIEKGLLPRLSESNGIDLCRPIVSLSLVAGKFVDSKAIDAVGRTPLISSFLASEPVASTSMATHTLDVSSHSSVQPTATLSSHIDVVDLSPGEPAARKGFFYRKTLQLIRKGYVV